MALNAAGGIARVSSRRGAVAEDMVLFVGGNLDAEQCASLAATAAARCAGLIALEELGERLERQGRLAILWLADAEPLTADLAEMIVREAARMDTAIICELSGTALDAAFAAFAHVPGTQFLSEPGPLDREMALAAALGARGPHVADKSADLAMERITQLQEEVARISAVLASLAERANPQLVSPWPVPVGFIPQIRSAAHVIRNDNGHQSVANSPQGAAPSTPVRRLLRQRRLREQFFPAELFADPAWDMLLDLYAARLEGHPVAVSSLCIAAAVPATTALRWIKTMTDSGLFERQADPRDGRRIFIGLSDKAAQAMARYFADLESLR